MSSRKRLTTSSRVKLSVLTPSGLVTQTANAAKIRSDRLAQEKELELRQAKLLSTARQTIAEAALEVGEDPADYQNYEDFIPEPATEPVWLDDEDGDDEGDGGLEGRREDKAADNERINVIRRFNCKRGRRRHDRRTRLERNRQQQKAWDRQMPSLVRAYLEWKYGQPDVTMVPAESHTFEIGEIGMREWVMKRPVQQLPEEEANISLIRIGLLGSAPIQPNVAFSLETLELYHQIRRRQSSFSVQAMAKVLCALNNVTYFQTLRNQLANAFDIYLRILREVQQHINRVLGRDRSWRIRFACPPCGFKLPDEPKLVPARLHAIDGNNSAKRVDGSGHADEREFPSEYLIHRTRVDRFKDDVHTRPGSKEPSGEAPPFGDDNTVCTDNWTTANAVSEGTVKVFDQTGIFICACRHGIIETVIEMLRSGELAKYGLATINEILDIFGDDQGMAYDIGCSHSATVRASSISDKARIHRLLLLVNAFHGHAHNRACQLQNHPMYLPGLGIEDLETCERIFAASNSVAPLIRHASYFHWLQFLDLHFDQWDKDKYLELSKFLYNNYVQALSIIKEYSKEIDDFKTTRGFSNEDFENWRTEELDYLTTVAAKPEYDVRVVAYVEALEALAKAQSIYAQTTTVEYLNFTPADFAPTGSLPSSAKAKALEAERSAAARKLLFHMNTVDDTERRLGIVERWTPEHPEFIKAIAFIKNKRFIDVVETLEGLVVQRLFELSKANLSSTGYKMRKHISNAITKRSAAVRTALDKYNALAPKQDPPRPVLDYTEVAAYGWLNDFELLKLSRHGVSAKPWAVPVNRTMASKYFKVRGAHVEIERLNIEIRRLHVWTDHEDRELLSAVNRVSDSDPLLSSALRSFYEERHRINNLHRARLQNIYNLPEFSGWLPPGTAAHGVGKSVTDPENEEGILAEEDDTLRDEVIRLGDCIDRMGLD